MPFNLRIVSVASTEPCAFADHEDIEQVADILTAGFSRLNNLEPLPESEHKWREIVEHVRDVIIIVDREGEIQFINHPAPGKTIEQMIGTSLIDYIAPEDRRKVQKALDQAMDESKDVRLESRASSPRVRMGSTQAAFPP